MTTPSTINWPTPSEAMRQAEEEFECLIGMEQIKAELQEIRNFCLTESQRRQLGDESEGIALHTVLLGPAGTGKTSVARILGKFFYGCGLLPTPKFIETDRGGLVEQWIGQTAPKTTAKVMEAMGGVLFIDEAYALAQSDSPRDFGPEAVATLIKLMEDHRDNLAVVFAGYGPQMETFLKSNPGIPSRVSQRFEIGDFNPQALCRVFEQLAWDKKFTLTPEAKARAAVFFHAAWATRSDDFGNGRFARKFLERSLVLQGNRLAGKAKKTELYLITEADLPVAQFCKAFDTRTVDIDNLIWRMTCPSCKAKASFQLPALNSEAKCKCGMLMVLPWESIDPATAGSAFQSLMTRAGFDFKIAEAREMKPRRRRLPAKTPSATHVPLPIVPPFNPPVSAPLPSPPSPPSSLGTPSSESPVSSDIDPVSSERSILAFVAGVVDVVALSLFPVQPLVAGFIAIAASSLVLYALIPEAKTS